MAMGRNSSVKITKARFIVPGIPAARMTEIGQTVIQSVFANWDRGLDTNDSPVPELASWRQNVAPYVLKATGDGLVGIRRSIQLGVYRGYGGYKKRRTGSDVRDLKLSGRLRRGIQVLKASNNTVTIGPIDGVHTQPKRGRRQMTYSDVLTANQRRWRMWGLSPTIKDKLIALIAAEHPVRVGTPPA